IGEILTNGHLWVQFPHVLFAAFATGAFLIAGVSAWKIARKHDVEMFKKSFKISIIVATVSALFVSMFGHQQAQYLVESQPMKLAAAEALWNTSEDPAPFTLIANIDTETQENSYDIQIPGLLSLFSYNKFSGQVEGMNQLQAEYEAKYGPGDYIPPVKTVFWSFRIMVFSGMAMLLLGLYGWYASRKDILDKKPFFTNVMVYAISLPFIANTFGWIMTEMGRQPWVVFGVMQTEDAVSPSVTFNEVLFSFVSFTLLYAILAGITIYLFVKHIKKKDHQEKTSKEIDDPF